MTREDRIKNIKVGTLFRSTGGTQYKALVVHDENILAVTNSNSTTYHFQKSLMIAQGYIVIDPPTAQEQRAIDLLKENGYNITR